MEWRKIRNWLLLMLLAADLVLAGNLAWQLLRGRQAERQAVLDAVAVAAARGVELDGEEVLRLPAEMTGYSARRSDALEQAAARFCIRARSDLRTSASSEICSAMMSFAPASASSTASTPFSASR